jgi:prolyl 4-hydroxylase
VRSTTAGHKSSTRTSTNTWLDRHSDPVIDAVYRRAADVLRLDEALLRHREPDEIPDMPTSAPINEEMQVVHYNEGEEYTAHHDFGYPKGTPNSPSRSINLCLYLNDVEEGGRTSFPRWRNGETSDSLDVKPEKLKAMIFYMVNPDGNLEDLSQHAALPVGRGAEKWFSNLWIWDDIRL